MKIKSLIIMIFIIVFTNSCNNTDEYMFGYPELITQNSLENIYDSARIIVYASNYHEVEYDHFDRWDSLSNNKYGLCKNIIECGLKMNYCSIKQDTFLFQFELYYKDTNNIIIPSWSISIDKIVYIKRDSFYYRIGDGLWYDDSFFIDQKQWEYDTTKVIDYEYYGIERQFRMCEERINFPKFLQQANRDSIHPWLLKEAIKRGMLKE